MPAYVYILKDGEGRYYTGSTKDIGRRFRQHQQGHTATTRKMKDLEIALVQEYETLEEARNVERRIKRMKRKDYIVKMIADHRIRMK